MTVLSERERLQASQHTQKRHKGQSGKLYVIARRLHKEPAPSRLSLQSILPAPLSNFSMAQMQNVSSTSYVCVAYANTRQTFLLSRTQRHGCKERLAPAKAVQAPRNNRQRSVVIARSVNAAAVEAPPKIEVIKKDTIGVLKVRVRDARNLICSA